MQDDHEHGALTSIWRSLHDKMEQIEDADTFVNYGLAIMLPFLGISMWLSRWRSCLLLLGFHSASEFNSSYVHLDPNPDAILIICYKTHVLNLYFWGEIVFSCCIKEEKDLPSAWIKRGLLQKDVDKELHLHLQVRIYSHFPIYSFYWFGDLETILWTYQQEQWSYICFFICCDFYFSI